MEEIIIPLTCTKKDIQGFFYFADSNKHLFVFPPAKRIFYWILGIVLFGIVIYLLSINYPVVSWLLLVAIFAIIICIFRLIQISAGYYLWKKGVNDYLKKMPNVINYKIILSDHCFEFVEHNESNTIKWESVKSLKTRDNYSSIVLENKETYVFPAISMKTENYKKLIAFIKGKIKQ